MYIKTRQASKDRNYSTEVVIPLDDYVVSLNKEEDGRESGTLSVLSSMDKEYDIYRKSGTVGSGKQEEYEIVDGLKYVDSSYIRELALDDYKLLQSWLEMDLVNIPLTDSWNSKRYKIIGVNVTTDNFITTYEFSFVDEMWFMMNNSYILREITEGDFRVDKYLNFIETSTLRGDNGVVLNKQFLNLTDGRLKDEKHTFQNFGYDSYANLLSHVMQYFNLKLYKFPKSRSNDKYTLALMEKNNNMAFYTNLYNRKIPIDLYRVSNENTIDSLQVSEISLDKDFSEYGNSTIGIGAYRREIQQDEDKSKVGRYEVFGHANYVTADSPHIYAPIYTNENMKDSLVIGRKTQDLLESANKQTITFNEFKAEDYGYDTDFADLDIGMHVKLHDDVGFSGLYEVIGIDMNISPLKHLNAKEFVRNDKIHGNVEYLYNKTSYQNLGAVTTKQIKVKLVSNK